MKTIFLVAGSRAGIEFFQSLLEDHPQILQFPGVIQTNKKFIDIVSHENHSDISSNFIKHFPHFFDSRLNSIERHYMLGENKNEYYLVDKEKFTINFAKLFNDQSKLNVNNKLFRNIIMLHLAYSLSRGHNIDRKKIMIINCHLIEHIKYISGKMSEIDFDIIHAIRNPLSAVSSPVNNWLKYENGKHFFARSIYFQLDLIVNAIKRMQEIKKNFFIVQLEKLHKNHLDVMTDFCKTYDLKYDNCMENSTYFNLKWWGDKVSGKDLNGVNKNFNATYNEKIFYKRDIKFIEYVLSDYIKFYGYKFTEKATKINYNLLPMKSEILTWKNTIRHKKIKHVFSIPFYYIKRLLFVNKFSQKNLKMPHSFGL